MNGDGGGFDFDLPDENPVAANLPPKPDVIARPAEAADQTLELLGDLLGQPGVDPDAVEWGEVPGAQPAQPDTGMFDPPSKDEIQLPE